MAKAKKAPEAETPEAPPAPSAPSWELATVSITKTKAEVITREVTLAQFNKLVAEHGGDKVKVLEVIK